jgi:hypothetical protein
MPSAAKKDAMGRVGSESKQEAKRESVGSGSKTASSARKEGFGSGSKKEPTAAELRRRGTKTGDPPPEAASALKAAVKRASGNRIVDVALQALATSKDGHLPTGHEQNEDMPEYKVGEWSKRNTYLPVLQWAGESNVLQDRFKNLVEMRNMNQIRILLHGGVSPNLRLYPLRRTALHRATELGDELLCQLLLSFKADPLLEDDYIGRAGEKSRMTPQDIAIKNQQLQLTHLFNAHLGQSHLLDVGPDAGPLRSDKPIRIHLTAYEPCFMSSK